MNGQDLWLIWGDQAALEARLDMLLQPVEPRPEFIRGLQVRLFKGEEPSHLESDLLRNVIYAIVGVASSLLIVITGVKATRSLLEQRRHLRARVQQEPAI